MFTVLDDSEIHCTLDRVRILYYTPDALHQRTQRGSLTKSSLHLKTKLVKWEFEHIAGRASACGLRDAKLCP